MAGVLNERERAVIDLELMMGKQRAQGECATIHTVDAVRRSTSPVLMIT
jgi:hypothetical protein